MSLTRWDPFREMATMRREMSRFFDEPFRLLWRPRDTEFEEAGAMDIDVYETDDNVVVEASLPGVKSEDVKLSASDHGLYIQAESKREREISRDRFHRQERFFGKWARNIMLPPYANVDQADASFKDGVLKVTMPKLEQAKARAIPVKALGEGTEGGR